MVLTPVAPFDGLGEPGEPGAPEVAVPGLNAANTAPQLVLAPNDAAAAADPAVGCTRSSTASFALGVAGTASRSVKPVPAVTLAGSAVMMTPISRSPLAVVAALPLVGAALVPWAAAVTSSELVVATPEYSRMARRSVPD